MTEVVMLQCSGVVMSVLWLMLRYSGHASHCYGDSAMVMLQCYGHATVQTSSHTVMFIPVR